MNHLVQLRYKTKPEKIIEQAKDNLTLNVILAYLQVLNNEDLLASSIKQKELSTKQAERLEILDSQGAVSPALVADVRGQLMNDELTSN